MACSWQRHRHQQQQQPMSTPALARIMFLLHRVTHPPHRSRLAAIPMTRINQLGSSRHSHIESILTDTSTLLPPLHDCLHSHRYLCHCNLARASIIGALTAAGPLTRYLKGDLRPNAIVLSSAGDSASLKLSTEDLLAS